MISKSYVNTILDTLVKRSSDTGFVYLGLCKTEPAHDTGEVSSEPAKTVIVDNETVSTGYERKSVKGYFSAANGGIVTNNAEIQMKTARQPWGVGEDKLMYWFLSHSSTGSAVIWGPIYHEDENGEKTAGIEVGKATVPTFYENQLRASIDVPLE